MRLDQKRIVLIALVLLTSIDEGPELLFGFGKLSFSIQILGIEKSRIFTTVFGGFLRPK
jgi:hypothetical protein